MRLTGRRESTNVDDRRSTGTGKKAGMGLGGLLLVAAMAYFSSGGDMGSVLNAVIQNASQVTTSADGGYTPSAQEEELATFTKQILAGTEDVWTAQFKRLGKTYKVPKLVMFHGSVSSGCGNATSAMGPFYCSADQTVYVDLDFFATMKKEYGADGDFAYAYVVAHEVGHHVQYLLGTLNSAHTKMSQVSEVESNQISVRIELQADFYAGVWAYQDNQMFNSLEDGDIEEGLAIASKIGDDYLQKKAQGYAVEESFTHGTAAQRMRWLKKGMQTGDIRQGNTFEVSESQL